MSTSLPQFVARFHIFSAYLRGCGWTWPFTLTGTQLLPIGMCRMKASEVHHQNDNDPDNTWRANAPR